MSVCSGCVWNTGNTCEKHIFAYPNLPVCAAKIPIASAGTKPKTHVEIFSSSEPEKCIFYAELP